MYEVEYKIPVDSIQGCQNLLRAAGCQLSDPYAMETVFLDTAENTIQNRGLVLRLRRSAAALDKWTVTFKGPVLCSYPKTRMELEYALPLGLGLSDIETPLADLGILCKRSEIAIRQECVFNINNQDVAISLTTKTPIEEFSTFDSPGCVEFEGITPDRDCRNLPRTLKSAAEYILGPLPAEGEVHRFHNVTE